MWRFAFVPMFMVLYDYIKAPIDRLYFTNPHRPLLGIRNTFREIIHCFSEHDVKHYPGLLLVKLNYKKIREEFERVSPTLKKRYQHDEDVWSEKNDGYYYYKVKDFPLLNSLVKIF